MDLSGISSSWVRKGLWPPWSRRMPSSTTCFKNCLFRTRAPCQETTYQLIKTFSGNISYKHLLCSHNICHKIEYIFDTFDCASSHIHCCFYLYPPHKFMTTIISKVRSDHSSIIIIMIIRIINVITVVWLLGNVLSAEKWPVSPTVGPGMTKPTDIIATISTLSSSSPSVDIAQGGIRFHIIMFSVTFLS